MRILAAITTLLAMLSSAFAQGGERKLETCASITEDASRLACFDKAASRTVSISPPLGHRQFTDAEFMSFVKGRSAQQIIDAIGMPNDTENSNGHRTMSYKTGAPPSYIMIKDALTGKHYKIVFVDFDASGISRYINFF